MKNKARVYEIILKVVDDYPTEEQLSGVKEVRENVAHDLKLANDLKLGLDSLKIRSLKVREIK